MCELLAQVPAHSVLASNLRLRLINDELRAINAYTQPDRDLTTQTEALMEIANAEVAVLRKDMVKARKLIARILHYHSNNREQAWSAYHQILADATRDGDLATQVIIRMQIAACAIELYEQTGLEWEELLPLLRDLRTQNEAAETARWDLRDAVSRQTRWTTARISLMITEVLIRYQRWAEAAAESTAMLTKYANLPECREELATAWINEAWVRYYKDYDLPGTFEAAGNALALADAIGRPIWGDPTRDVAWQATAWQYYCARYDKAGKVPATMEQIRKRVRQRFPDHPSKDRLLRDPVPSAVLLEQQRRLGLDRL